MGLSSLWIWLSFILLVGVPMATAKGGSRPHPVSAEDFQALARKNAPLIWIHSEETAMPTDPMEFLKQSSIWRYHPFTADEEMPPELNLFERAPPAQRDSRAMFLPTVFALGARETYYLRHEAGRIQAAAHSSTVSAPLLWRRGATTSTSEGREISMIEYWHHYDVSGAYPWPDTLGHQGDWESFAALIDETGASVAYYLRQHETGEWLCSSDLGHHNGRIELFSARSSHATYPAAGNHLKHVPILDQTDRGTSWETWKNIRPLTREAYYNLNLYWGVIRSQLFRSGPIAPNASERTLRLPMGTREAGTIAMNRAYERCRRQKGASHLL